MDQQQEEILYNIIKSTQMSDIDNQAFYGNKLSQNNHVIRK